GGQAPGPGARDRGRRSARSSARVQVPGRHRAVDQRQPRSGIRAVRAGPRGDPWILARTLLQAGWAPYWRNDLATARAMFQEALEVARTNPAGDRWAEARALVMLAAVAQESEDEEAAFALASESLAVAEAAGDRFAIAVAREAV